MYEDPEANTEPTTSSLTDKEDNLSTLVKEPDEVQETAETTEDVDAETTEDVDATTEDAIETIEAPAIVQKNDSESEEIRIVAVASAATDDLINKIINDEQQSDDSKSVKSINNSQAESTPAVKPSDDRNETRVISLDTIIRKGLNEQMPMTAKDIDNIVPNAIKQQQDADLKQSEKLANEKEFALVYESSDDYNSSGDEKFEDELVEDAKPTNEETTNAVTVTANPVADDNENKTDSPEPTSEDLPKDNFCSDPDPSVAKDDTEAQVEATNDNFNESHDSSTSDHSFDELDSGSDSSRSSHKKRKRRKSSTATQNKVKDDLSMKSDEVGDNGEDMASDAAPLLNRRGKPRKSYDETDNEQVKKKVGRKLKIQRYSGPKRVRVSDWIFGSHPRLSLKCHLSFSRVVPNVMTA